MKDQREDTFAAMQALTFTLVLFLTGLVCIVLIALA